MLGRVVFSYSQSILCTVVPSQFSTVPVCVAAITNPAAAAGGRAERRHEDDGFNL